MSSNYANNINFGKAINQNINRVDDPQNPLTMCLFPDLGTQFLHGATSTFYKPYCGECQNYMADRCAGVYNQSEAWDDKCNLYVAANTQTIWPNQAAINQTAAVISPSFRMPRTVGEQLLRNTLERRFLVYIQNPLIIKQFDQNIPNSPYYRSPCSKCATPRVKFIDAATIDHDPVMNAGLDNYTACTDVFAIIWSAWKNNKLNIKGTKLEQNLASNGALYNDILGRIDANTARLTKGGCGGGSCKHKDAMSQIVPNYGKGLPNC